MIKYAVHFILWNHKPTKGTRSYIYLRINIKRVSKYISTGIHVTSRSWDARNELVVNHALADLYNADLAARKQNIIRFITEKQLQGVDVTAAQLKDQFANAGNYNNLFDFAEKFISEVKHKRSAGIVKNYRKVLKKIELFAGKNISFEQINHDWLVKFENKLREENLSNNYIHAIWRVLKTFFNAAKKRKLITDYPFETYDNPKYVSPDKDYLTLFEIGEIEKLADETKDPTIKQTCVYFLLGCYTGLRISDWYQFDIKKHVKGNEILLRAKKNKEWVTMPIHSRLKRNLKRMQEIPLKITEVEINRTLKDIAEKLSIKKHLHAHISRHSFAVTMCLNRGISSEVAAELMAITLLTFVNNYSQITKSKIHQEALRAWKNL